MLLFCEVTFSEPRRAANVDVCTALSVVTGYGGISDREATDLFAYQQRLFKTVGVNLSLRSVGRYNDEPAGMAALDNNKARFDYWMRRLWKIAPAECIAHAITSPLIGENKLWYAGFAHADVRTKAFSLSTAGNYAAGRSAVIKSRDVMAHELGHDLCAQHDNSLPYSLMNADGATFTVQGATHNFSPRSKREIRRCLSWIR